MLQIFQTLQFEMQFFKLFGELQAIVCVLLCNQLSNANCILFGMLVFFFFFLQNATSLCWQVSKYSHIFLFRMFRILLYVEELSQLLLLGNHLQVTVKFYHSNLLLVYGNLISCRGFQPFFAWQLFANYTKIYCSNFLSVSWRLKLLYLLKFPLEETN